jgi:predicted XRE-type DNA-binding protein
MTMAKLNPRPVKKGMSWPSEKELAEMREKLSKGPASQILPRDASPVDKFKYSICREILRYEHANNLTQRQMAEILGEDEAIVSKVVHYYIDEFTIDRLLRFLHKIYPNAEIKIKVA